MTRRFVLLGICLAGLSIALLSGPVVNATRQNTPPQDPQQRPTFVARIDAVSVDVIVTDRQGRPVTDLTADDFEVTENKTP
jgi:hypothetical protein